MSAQQNGLQTMLRMGLLPLLMKKMGMNMPMGRGGGGQEPPAAQQPPPILPGQGGAGRQPPASAQPPQDGGGGGGPQVQNDPKSAVGNFNAPVAQPVSEIHSLQQLLTGWSSRKQQKQQAEASNAAQALMQAIEGAKTTGDWSAANDILHENEKLFNKVYKGWLQKAESQKKQSQSQNKADPDTHGFEQGVQEFLNKKQKGGGQQPQPAPAQGSAPTTMGGYHLPAASPQQELAQRGTSATRQAISQDPNLALSSQLTSEERRETELGAGPEKVRAEMEAAQAKIKVAALSVQKAQAESVKAMTELKIKEGEVMSSKEKGQVSLDIERTRHQKSLVDLDIARARLALTMKRGPTGGKTPPANLTKQLAAAKEAEDLLSGMVKQGAGGFSAEDSQKLQALLMQAGSSSLAKDLPSWFGSRWFSGTKDIEKLLGSIQSYQKGLKEAMSNYAGTEKPAAKSGAVDAASGDDDEVDADIVVNPEDMDN